MPPSQHIDQRDQAVKPPASRRPAAARPESDGPSLVQPGSAADHVGQDEPNGTGRDALAVRGFIERFTAQLNQTGFPRTPARIFVALLTSDSSTLTAAELADLLRTSPASVSSGVRYLLQVGLVAAEGEPGSRRLHYRMSTRVWEDIVQLRDRQFSNWAAELRNGVAVLGPATPAGARMAETVRYFEFISQEITGLLFRWRARSASTGPAADGAER